MGYNFEVIFFQGHFGYEKFIFFIEAVEGDVSVPDFSIFCHNSCQFNDRFQFANIPREGVVEQFFPGITVYFQGAKPVFLCKRFQEMPGKQNNVISTLAKGGEAYRQAKEPLKEVFPEPSFFHFLGQVAMGGYNDTHIQLDCVVSANACNFFFLKYAKQLGLKVQIHFPNFIQ